MEQINNTSSVPAIITPIEIIEEANAVQSSLGAFIEANTTPGSLYDIKANHVIPVWYRDNEPLISHGDFIDIVGEVLADVFQGERILEPAIRMSHPIKGRVPSAKDKPAHLLSESEKTLFYERMMFVFQIPGITSLVGGNELSLTIGGVKSYGEDNLYQRSGGDQHFKIFVGFQNRVCANLCVWSDGFSGGVTVKSLSQLKHAVMSLLENYNARQHLLSMKQLTEHEISEQQFAQLIGKCRMYQHLPNNMKQGIPPMLFGDQQLGSLIKDYYRDKNFCGKADGSLNLWKLYNLFTNANKATYLDQLLHRSVNAFDFVNCVRMGLDGKYQNWYLN